MLSSFTRDESFLKTTMKPLSLLHDRLVSLGSLHSATISVGFFRHVCIQPTILSSFRMFRVALWNWSPLPPPLAILRDVVTRFLRRSLDHGERSDLEIALAAPQREQRPPHHCKYNLGWSRVFTMKWDNGNFFSLWTARHQNRMGGSYLRATVVMRFQ